MKAWRKGVLKNPKIMIGAPADVSNDRQVRVAAVLGTLRQSEKALQQSSSLLVDNRNVIIELLNKDLASLQDASMQSARDRKHLLKDVHEDFTALRTRARELEVERKILLEDLSDNLSEFDEKAAGVQATRQEMLVWLRNNRTDLEQRQEELVDDEGLDEVRSHWDWIEQLHEGLLEDRDMIVQQVMKYWPGLNYVAEHIRADRTVLLEEVKPYIAARTVEDVCRHESNLYFECESILDVVMEDSVNIESMSRKLRQSHHICNKVIQEDWNQLEKTTDAIRADRSFVVAIVENTLSGGKW
jgi:adenylate kinase